MQIIFNFFRDLWAKITGKDPDRPGPSATVVEPVETPLPTPDHVPTGTPTPSSSKYPYLADAVFLTGGFEGSGYDQVTGDFDGQGMSVGVLQWNFGQGTLQSVILDRYRAAHGSIDKLGIFPVPGVDALEGLTRTGTLYYVRKNMLSGKSVRKDWALAWSRFLSRPEVRQLQNEGCHSVAAGAQKLCDAWGMTDRRAFCFFFDIVTQNGSMKDVTKPMANIHTAKALMPRVSKSNRAIWTRILETGNPTADQLILFIAGYQRALRSNSAYFQDVWSRKGTIALGEGIVHGKRVVI